MMGETAGIPNEARGHILVVDDDKRLRQLLHRYLTGNGFVVDTAGDAAEARAKLRSLAFDLLILDVMMPGESGLELTADLRRNGELPILLLTAMGGAEDRIAGLERGADDYLAKPFEPRELLLRIGNILRRASPAAPAPETLAFGDFTFEIGRSELRRRGAVVHLTSGEAALLRIFAQNPGIAISREELGSRSAGNERSVDVQVTRLRRKIEVDPRNPRFLVTVRGEGYVLRAI